MFIYFCKNCNKFDAFKSENGKFKCSDCKMELIPLGVTVDEWNALSNDQMLEAMERAQKPFIKEPTFSHDETNYSREDSYDDFDEVEYPESSSKATRIIVIIVAVLIAVAVIVWGAYYFIARANTGEDKKEPPKTEIKTEKIESSGSTEKEVENSALLHEPTEEEKQKAEAEEEKKPVKRENTNFRNTCWGDSMETVRESEEGDPVDETSDGLAYEGTLDGHSVYILYTFQNGKLVQAAYALTEDLRNGGQYIALFEQWEETLTKRYGNPDPETSGMVSYVEDNLIELAGPARALEYGYTAYIDDWYKGPTHIRMGLISTDYEMKMMISYYDKENYVSDDGDAF